MHVKMHSLRGRVLHSKIAFSQQHILSFIHSVHCALLASLHLIKNASNIVAHMFVTFSLTCILDNQRDTIRIGEKKNIFNIYMFMFKR